MTNHEKQMAKYEKIRARNWAKRAKAIRGLLPEQQAAIFEVQDALRGALQMIDDCKDLHLSDIAKMESAFWAIRNNFNFD